MGQEASLPQGGGDDFEKQARAPPSSINPPVAPVIPVRPGTKMINTIMHRATAGVGHQDFEVKELARAAAEAGQMPFSCHHYGNGPPLVQSQLSPYPNLHQLTPDEQHKSLLHQRQQMIHNQFHEQQHAHVTSKHFNSSQHEASHQATANVHAGLGPSGFYASTVGRKGGRGKALINSMKNLSIGNTIRSGVQATAHVAVATASAAVATAQAVNANVKGKVGGVSDWETRWDEDEDDSDGEEENDLKPAAALSGASAVHQSVDVSSMRRPVEQASIPLKSQLRSNVVTPSIGDEAVGEDGVEWDTGGQLEPATKPNVQMFLPLLRVLGKGSFGKVVLVQKRVGKERGSLFAMKILRKTHLVKRRQIERTRTERMVLSAVNHPFIMKLHFAFQTPEKLYLVLDYCPGGELFFHLSRIRRFPERVARFYAAELLLAIGHLHKRGIIYRDLKPENVLLDADGHVKLGDFGLAKAGLKHPCEGATSMCGTPEYMAPEVLSQHGHGFCVDYWGLGMLVYEMMTGLPPWYTTDRARLFRRLKSAPLDIPNYFSAQSANCVSSLLERNPRQRLGVAGVRTAMEHDFFRNINWRALYAKRVEAPIRPCEGWKPPEAVKGEGDYDAIDNQYAAKVSSSVTNDVGQMNKHDLDAATANFDDTFTRMPVHTEEGAEQGEEGEPAEQLNEDTFIGFSFDDKDQGAQVVGSQPTYHHETHEATPAPQQPRTLD